MEETKNIISRPKEFKQSDILDITKFVLSFFIIAIHIDLFPLVLYPWLRMAVPLYFVISSYLLYSKINDNPDNEALYIKKYLKRQLQYWLFWFVTLIPVTLFSNRALIREGG